MTLPRIGITLGDPGGIGPEVTLKALASINSLPQARYTLFGSRLVVEEAKKTLGLDLDIPSFNKKENTADSFLSLHDIKTSLTRIKKGAPLRENGEASFRFFEEAVNKVQEGSITAIVTAPISKHSWSLAGIKWTGHTDYLSHYYPGAIMSFWSEKIKIALFTHHIPLKEAIKKIKKKSLLQFLLYFNENITKLTAQAYHLLVPGLNPHAGEKGLMGSEEIYEIIPAIEAAKKEGVPLSGPYPPDTIFRTALNQRDKIVIALYHDQGLIPFKLEEFEKGVNVTFGLPFIRTSPDHGTAFDIAGKGKANPQSMIEAIRLAFALSVSL